MSSDCFHDLVKFIRAMKAIGPDRRERPQLVGDAEIIERTNDLNLDW